ncbi:MAG: DUF2911 domain-containing protein [Cyclobacteriaceae bacterium]
MTIVLITCLGSCSNSDPNTRPSPLKKDSLIINNNLYKTEYSSPSVRKRKIWGELEPYNQVWRTGANDATIIEVETDILLSGKRLPKGKYAFFTIPGQLSWTMIFNKEWEQWGAYNYNSEKDQLRIKVEPEWLPENQEKLKIYFTKNEFVLRWEFVKVAVPFEVLD